MAFIRKAPAQEPPKVYPQVKHGNRRHLCGALGDDTRFHKKMTMTVKFFEFGTPLYILLFIYLFIFYFLMT
jgi:hypothetical protein